MGTIVWDPSLSLPSPRSRLEIRLLDLSHACRMQPQPGGGCCSGTFRGREQVGHDLSKEHTSRLTNRNVNANDNTVNIYFNVSLVNHSQSYATVDTSGSSQTFFLSRGFHVVHKHNHYPLRSFSVLYCQTDGLNCKFNMNILLLIDKKLNGFYALKKGIPRTGSVEFKIWAFISGWDQVRSGETSESFILESLLWTTRLQCIICPQGGASAPRVLRWPAALLASGPSFSSSLRTLSALCPPRFMSCKWVLALVDVLHPQGWRKASKTTLLRQERRNMKDPLKCLFAAEIDRMFVGFGTNPLMSVQQLSVY